MKDENGYDSPNCSVHCSVNDVIASVTKWSEAISLGEGARLSSWDCFPDSSGTVLRTPRNDGIFVDAPPRDAKVPIFKTLEIARVTKKSLGQK